MCRFLLVRSKNKIEPTKLLKEFAFMCSKSRTSDGDWHGDGWGFAWRKEGKWELRKSLLPIWEEKDIFSKFPKTNLFVVHARSAGFPQHRGDIDFNQPFIEDSLCFVFNGMIRGINLPIPLDGKIGAQKVFSLLQKTLMKDKTKNALRVVDRLILERAKKIEGMNIGLVQDDKFYILCEYEDNKEYFGLYYYKSGEITLVCSKPIGSYRWQIIEKGEIIVL